MNDSKINKVNSIKIDSIKINNNEQDVTTEEQYLATEISDRTSLESNAYLLRTLIDTAPDYIYVKDTKSRFIICNKPLINLLGMKTESDLIGKTDFDFYPQELAAKYYADDQAVMQTGTSLFNHEEPNINAAGNYRYDLTSKTPLRDVEGNIIGLLGISRDITEIKLVEEALTHEKNLLRTLVDNLPDHIFAKDANGRFIFANVAVANHMGETTPDELINKTDFDFYPIDLAEKFFADEQALIQSGQSILNHEEFNRTAKGDNIWTLTTKVILHDSKGEPSGLIGIGRDISELKKTHAELEKTFTDLKENQQKLLASEKMASLGRLTAGIAHEMNTPLSTVQSALYQVVNLINEYKMSIDNPEVQPEDHKQIADDMFKIVKLAIHAVEKSSGFIRGIKAQTYDMKNNKNELFSASPIIKDTIDILRFSLKKGNCTVQTELDETIKIFGNPRWLGQIITNLVINAIDACSPDGGTIKLSLNKNDNSTIVLKIYDTGAGIPHENLSRIFDPMFTTKKFGEGTGLGLSIIHDMIYEMKGTIEVSSKPGDTVFIINLPTVIQTSD